MTPLSNIGVTSVAHRNNRVIIRIRKYKTDYNATQILKAIQDRYTDYPIVISVKLDKRRCFVELGKLDKSKK